MGQASRENGKIMLDKLNFKKYFLITFCGYQMDILTGLQKKRGEI